MIEVDQIRTNQISNRGKGIWNDLFPFFCWNFRSLCPRAGNGNFSRPKSERRKKVWTFSPPSFLFLTAFCHFQHILSYHPFLPVLVAYKTEDYCPAQHSVNISPISNEREKERKKEETGTEEGLSFQRAFPFDCLFSSFKSGGPQVHFSSGGFKIFLPCSVSIESIKIRGCFLSFLSLPGDTSRAGSSFTVRPSLFQDS